MANYSKTQELFDRELNRVPSLKYEKSGEQLSEEKWFAQVKNPNTGEFFQLEDLSCWGFTCRLQNRRKTKEIPCKEDRRDNQNKES